MKNAFQTASMENLNHLRRGHSNFTLEACGRNSASDPKREPAEREGIIDYNMADFPFLPSEEQLREAMELMDDLSSGDLLDLELECHNDTVGTATKMEGEQADPTAPGTDNAWPDEGVFGAKSTRYLENGISNICDDYGDRADARHPLHRSVGLNTIKDESQIITEEDLEKFQSDEKGESSDSASGDVGGSSDGSQECKLGRYKERRSNQVRTKSRGNSVTKCEELHRSDEIRRLRRVLSNRESARRSRKRRADQIVTLEQRLKEAYDKINSLQTSLESAKARLFVVETEKSQLQTKLASVNGVLGQQPDGNFGTEETSQIPSTPFSKPRSSNVVHFKSPIRQLQTNRLISFRLRPKSAKA